MKLLSIAILFFVTNAISASFDCAKASTKIEKAICANLEISKLDEEVARLYKELKNIYADSDFVLIKAEQKYWITHRNDSWKGSSMALAQLYKDRIGDLNLKISIAHDGKPYFGEYILPHQIFLAYETPENNMAAASDYVAFKLINTNELQFTVNVVATNAHTGEIDGTATKKGDTFIWIDNLQSDIPDQHAPCKITVLSSPTTISIKAQNCDYLGGANVSFDITARKCQAIAKSW